MTIRILRRKCTLLFSTHKTSDLLWSICYLKGKCKFIVFDVYAFLDDMTSHKWGRYVFPHYDDGLLKSFMDVTYLFCFPTHFTTLLPSPTVSPKYISIMQMSIILIIISHLFLLHTFRVFELILMKWLFLKVVCFILVVLIWIYIHKNGKHIIINRIDILQINIFR